MEIRTTGAGLPGRRRTDRVGHFGLTGMRERARCDWCDPEVEKQPWCRNNGAAGTVSEPRDGEANVTMADTIRNLLVDDHHIVRQGFAALLKTVPGFAVVAEASDGEQAVESFRKQRPM